MASKKVLSSITNSTTIASFSSSDMTRTGGQTESKLEETILNANKPMLIEEELPVIEFNGVKGYWINKDEVENWRGKLPINQYKINEDRHPKIIKKKLKEKIDQNQFIGINYLRPPTPPRPGDIIIREEPPTQAPPLSPIVKREVYYIYKDCKRKEDKTKPPKQKSKKHAAKNKPDSPLTPFFGVQPPASSQQPANSIQPYVPPPPTTYQLSQPVYQQPQQTYQYQQEQVYTNQYQQNSPTYANYDYNYPNYYYSNGTAYSDPYQYQYQYPYNYYYY